MAGKGKTPGDGQPFTTREEQEAALSERQIRDGNTAREHGLDGLGIIAERNQAEADG